MKVKESKKKQKKENKNKQDEVIEAPVDEDIFEIDKEILPNSFNPIITNKTLKRAREIIDEKYKEEFKGSATATGDFKLGQKGLKYNFSPQLSKIDSHWDHGFTIKKVKPGSQAFTIEKNGILFEANKSHLKLDTSAASL